MDDKNNDKRLFFLLENILVSQVIILADQIESKEESEDPDANYEAQAVRMIKSKIEEIIPVLGMNELLRPLKN